MVVTQSGQRRSTFARDEELLFDCVCVCSTTHITNAKIFLFNELIISKSRAAMRRTAYFVLHVSLFCFNKTLTYYIAITWQQIALLLRLMLRKSSFN